MSCGSAVPPDQSTSPRWLYRILLAAAVLRLVGLAWGLPAADGWDSDGIAPRDFLGGIVQTYTPGSYFTYPPLHLILLAALTSPGWLIGIINAPTLSQADVVREFIQTPYMTFFSLAARLVSVAMSVGMIYYIGRMTRLVAGERASLIAAAITALNAVQLYYGQTSNLDGPYMFWSALAISLVMEAIACRQPKRLAGGVLCFFCAVSTKDQAYALAILGFPCVIVGWIVCDDWARRQWLDIVKPIATALIAGAVIYAIVSGAAFNPTGFARRLSFLTGTASADNADYSSNFDGRLRIIYDGLLGLGNPYPLVFVGLGFYGIVVWCYRFRKNDAGWVAGWLPLLAMTSFTLCFNFVALRTDDRFLLPQSVLMAVYIGIGAAHLLTIGPRSWRGLAAALLASAFAVALYGCLSVDAAFLRDPRYDAEHWLTNSVAPGATIETYGKNVYLPRFPPSMHVARVGPEPVAGRNPLAGAKEIEQPFDGLEERRPDVIVLSTFWVSRYLVAESGSPGFGRAFSALQQDLFTDLTARKFFSALLSERRNYCIAHVSRFNASGFREVHIHQSLNEDIIILKRDQLRCPSSSN